MRFGPAYPNTRRTINQFEELGERERRQWIFERVCKITRFAYETIPFYRNHYQALDFDPYSLKLWEDLNRIPVITKQLLQAHSLIDRSRRERSRMLINTARMLINTGGTSGEPMEFFVDRKAYAREWAHMHTV